MKNFILTIFLIIFGYQIHSAEVYCGACTANCNFWCISYTVDCDGRIENFVSVHVSDGGWEINNQDSAPGWVGLFPPSLSDACGTNVCG
jgi:hypothetical protein